MDYKETTVIREGGMGNNQPRGYVTIVTDAGKRILTDRSQSKPLLVHFFDFEVNGNYSREYRSELAQSFDFRGHSHMIGEWKLRQYSPRVNFVLIEVTELWKWEGVKTSFSWTDASDALLSVDVNAVNSIPIEEIREIMQNLLVRKHVAMVPNKICRSWYSLGYYEKVRSWIEETLSDKHISLRERPEQISCGRLSTIYVLTTETGRLFFKACASDVGEVPITKTLATLFPEYTDNIIALSPELEAFMTEDHGADLPDLLDNFPDSERQNVMDAALKQWATLQIQSLDVMDKRLQTERIVVQDASWMRKGFDDLLHYIEHNDHFSKQQHNDLVSSKKFLDVCLKMWEDSGIPQTLIHGDLFEGNVCRPHHSANFSYFDWQCAAISYPFMDLRDPDPDMFRMFRNVSSYFECWTSYADLAAIRKLADWTKPLRELLDAISAVRDGGFDSISRSIEVSICLTSYLGEVSEILPSALKTTGVERR